MLTFEQKQAIIETYPQLVKKEISMDRLNYHFKDSLFEKTVVVEKLHPNGNGYVFVGDLLRYEHEAIRGLVNIRDYNEQQLREIIEAAIEYLSEEDDYIVVEPEVYIWKKRDGSELTLKNEERNWNIYFNNNLEETFGTKEAAEQYLKGEGFRRAK